MNESNRPWERGPRHRGRFELFYYEQVGSRSYLRLTRLALLLIVSFTVVPVAALFILFAWNSRQEPPGTNVNVSLPPATPFDANKPVIRMRPPSTPARAVPMPTMPPMPEPPAVQKGGTDALPTLSPTPSPKPTKTPT